MLGQRFSPIGLDLGEKASKAVQLKLAGGRIVLHDYAVVDTPGGSLAAGEIKDIPALEKILAGLGRGKRFKGRRVNCNINPRQVYLRPLILPAMEPRELAEAVYWETRKYVESAMEDPVVDFCTLGEKQRSGKLLLDVLAVAVPRMVVESYYYLLIRSGWEPLAMEIEQLSLFRLVGNIILKGTQPYDLQGRPFLVLDIGSGSTKLIIMEGKKLLFCRTIKAGIDYSGNKPLRNSGGEIVADREGSFNIEDRRLLSAARIISSEVERSLEYFSFHLDCGGKEVRCLYLTGGGSAVNGLSSFLSGKLEMEARFLDPFSQIRIGEAAKKTADKDAGASLSNPEKVLEHSAGVDGGNISFLLAPALGASLRRWNGAFIRKG